MGFNLGDMITGQDVSQELAASYDYFQFRGLFLQLVRMLNGLHPCGEFAAIENDKDSRNLVFLSPMS